jgi:hypothetical protein
MSIVERLYAPLLERPSPGAFPGAPDNKDDVIALHRSAHGSAFFWPLQLLPARRHTGSSVRSSHTTDIMRPSAVKVRRPRALPP